MPLVKIDIIREAWSGEEVRKLADVVQDVMLEHFNAPPRDRYQVITQHDPSEIICEDSGLGYTRTNRLVIIQIFQQNRSSEMKAATFKALKETLEKNFKLDGGDLIVSVAKNEREDWSLGMGKQTLIDGTL